MKEIFYTILMLIANLLMAFIVFCFYNLANKFEPVLYIGGGCAMLINFIIDKDYDLELKG